MRRGSSIACLAILAGALAGAPTASASRVETWTVPSRYVDFSKEPHIPPPPGQQNVLHLNVFMPDGYDGKKRFPILWLFHGHGGRYTSWVDSNGEDLMRIAPRFPGIIVMPEAGNGWCTNWWKGGARKPEWERYHLEELMHVVTTRLRIRPGRRWHAIAGLSMGGGCAAYYATQRPGYFGAVAPFSAPLNIQRPEWPAGMTTQGESSSDVYGDPEAQKDYWSGHNPLALLPNLRYTRIYVATGDGTPTKPQDATDGSGVRIAAELELHQQAVDFADAARKLAVPVTTDFYPGVHQEAYWQRDLLAAIRWGLFQPVSGRPASWTYSTIAQHTLAWDVRLDFTAAPNRLATFTRSGRTLKATGAGKVLVRTHGYRPFTASLPFTHTLQRPRPRARRRSHG